MNPCVKCGKAVDNTQELEAMMYDLPPCCVGCQSDVSAYCALSIPFWPASWQGGYYWSKKEDCYIPTYPIDPDSAAGTDGRSE